MPTVYSDDGTPHEWEPDEPTRILEHPDFPLLGKTVVLLGSRAEIAAYGKLVAVIQATGKAIDVIVSPADHKARYIVELKGSAKVLCLPEDLEISE